MLKYIYIIPVLVTVNIMCFAQNTINFQIEIDSSFKNLEKEVKFHFDGIDLIKKLPKNKSRFILNENIKSKRIEVYLTFHFDNQNWATLTFLIDNFKNLKRKLTIKPNSNDVSNVIENYEAFNLIDLNVFNKNAFEFSKKEFMMFNTLRRDIGANNIQSKSKPIFDTIYIAKKKWCLKFYNGNKTIYKESRI